MKEKEEAENNNRVKEDKEEETKQQQQQQQKPKEKDIYKNFIHFIDRGEEWKDLKPIPQFSEKVEIIKIQFNKCYQEIMDYFRGILAINEISLRAYNLTTEVLKVLSN